MNDDPDLIVCSDCGRVSYDPDVFEEGPDGPICAMGCGPASEGEELPPMPGGGLGTVWGPR